MTTATKPKKLRGAALARQVLNIIEAEEERRAGRNRHDTEVYADGNVWVQGSWYDIEHQYIPAGTKAKILHKSDNVVKIALQPQVSCGTSMCFAGHAVALHGDRFIADVYADYNKVGKVARRGERDFQRLIHQLNDDTEAEVLPVSEVITRNGRKIPIDDRARKLLGLSREDSDILFAGGNTLDDLRFFVSLIERYGKISGTPEYNHYVYGKYDDES